MKRALRELTGTDHVVYGAGRTDAGAHAEGQVASFQFEGRIPAERLAAALNARLPQDVAVLSAAAVPDGFHARFSARRRRYRYRYLDRAARPALGRGRCWHVRDKLDVKAMSQAAEALRGKHDWTTFCSASEPAGARVREMRSATVRRRGEFVELELVAEASSEAWPAASPGRWPRSAGARSRRDGWGSCCERATGAWRRKPRRQAASPSWK